MKINNAFWNHPLIIIIRWIIFLPLQSIGIGKMFFIVIFIITWFMKFSIGWIFLVIIFGLLIQYVFSIPMVLFSQLLVRLCPKLKVGQITYIVLSLIELIFLLQQIWNPSKCFGTVQRIVFTFIGLYLLWFMIAASGILAENKDQQQNQSS